MRLGRLRLSIPPTSARLLHAQIDVTGLAIGRATSLRISSGVMPPPEDYFHYRV